MSAEVVASIVRQLREASDAYYNGGTDILGDEVYDALLERLKELDPENPYLEEVGAPPPTEGAVTLPFAMPSLDKIKPAEDRLTRFLAATPLTGLVMSEKLDGLSALWVASSRKLYLRGDGIVGQDISHLAGRGIQGLNCGGSGLIVRGELVLPRAAGEQLARSWVNGMIHRNNPDPTDIRKIRFVAYELLQPAGLSRSEQFKALFTSGFETPWRAHVTHTTEAELIKSLQERRVTGKYDTDGIVVAYDLPPKSESRTDKARNPKDCVAFKMPLADQSAETIVREVLWGMSNQGYLIPKLQFDPVVIGSATIQYCTAHNAKVVQSERLGPGARIVVRRSGDVIPKLDRVVVAAAAASMPPTGTYEWDATGTHIRTVAGAGGPSKEIQVARLGHFLKTLEIPGAGPATAIALVEAGISGPATLWSTSAERLGEVLGPKTGGGLWTNLRAALEKATEMDLMIASSEMPRGCGQTKLLTMFARDADPRRWRIATGCEAPAGWSQQTLAALWTALTTYEAWRARELPMIPYPKMGAAGLQTVTAPPQGGKVICMTGFRDKDLEAKATAKGYTVSGTLTAKVNLLLVADGEVKESEKVKAARAKGIPILSRAQFVAQYLG
jgi:DNA ligase (NAD+)